MGYRSLIFKPLAFARIALAILAVSAWSLPSNVGAAIPNPFFTTTPVSFSNLSAFTKWTSLMPRYNKQKAAAQYCDGSECMATRWEALIVELKGKPVREQLDAVNRFFNTVSYVEDSANYGQDDYWATPYEFMERGGDCEDYAIAKYITLKRLGVPASSMRIVILQDNNLGGIMHAVLETRIGKQRFLLDNQAKEVTDEASIYHYRPIYALNSSAWWAYQ